MDFGLGMNGLWYPKRLLGAVDLTGSAFKGNLDVANVTKDGSNRISQVNDLSGNARHPVQATDANKIVWQDQTKDRGIVDTGGSAFKRVMKTGLAAQLSHYEWTIALIVAVSTAPSAGNLHIAMNASDSTTGRGGFSVGWFTTTQTRRFRTTSPAAVTRDYDFGAPSLNAREIWVIRVTGPSNGGDGTVSARVNGSVIAGSGTAFSQNVAANGSFFIGTSNANGASWLEYVELWNRALNDASVAQLESDLNAAYTVF